MRKMITVAELTFLAALTMLASTSLGFARESGLIHVRGKVLCQDCNYGGYYEWIHDANPIKGSKVSITCMDERGRVIDYRSDETDEQGQYDIIISKYIHTKQVKPKLCSVRLVSSPNPACNVFTNFGGGKTGINLHKPTTMYHDLIKYTLDPFYFTTPMCEKPDIN